MTAKDAAEIAMSNYYRKDAAEYAICTIEKRIRSYAEKGERECLIDFWNHPFGYLDFEKKYGKDKRDFYKQYNVEKEVREYYESKGFIFKLVTDFICGGVRQDPFWVIRW